MLGRGQKKHEEPLGWEQEKRIYFSPCRSAGVPAAQTWCAEPVCLPLKHSASMLAGVAKGTCATSGSVDDLT